MATFAGNANKILTNDCRDKIAIILRVKSVDDEYNKMKIKGVDFINEPVDIETWGMRVVHLRDTEGNLIELCSELLNKSIK
jgi:predicted enzyme related to lactoylglutathione lyase